VILLSAITFAGSIWVSPPGALLALGSGSRAPGHPPDWVGLNRLGRQPHPDDDGHPGPRPGGRGAARVEAAFGRRTRK